MHLDKYYTPPELAEYIVYKTKEIIGENNISEYIEPSAGSGVFLDYLPRGTLSYDIEPEKENIIKQDYLKLDLDYKKGRCIIGNPPYGARNTLSVQFYKKSIQLGDYIAFILPISQLHNNQQMYEFDLIHSEDLGRQTYTDRKIHCCFNIYKRPDNGQLNKKPNYKLKDVKIFEYRRNERDVKNLPYDLRICAYGASIGKEFCFIINNKNFKNVIITLIKNTKWKEIYPMTSTPSLTQWQVYKYIKEQIPEIN